MAVGKFQLARPSGHGQRSLLLTQLAGSQECDTGDDGDHRSDESEPTNHLAPSRGLWRKARRLTKAHPKIVRFSLKILPVTHEVWVPDRAPSHRLVQQVGVLSLDFAEPTPQLCVIAAL